MRFQLSDIGARFNRRSGIEQLMDDLGHAMQSGGEEVLMLGGGNPASISEVAQVWRQETSRMLSGNQERFDRMLGAYDPCRGNPRFLQCIVDFFNRTYSWGISTENVVVTNGGQTAFFYLLNLLAGPTNGDHKRILLPLQPEYIGYADQSLTGDFFRSTKPQVQDLDSVTFKYGVDFEQLAISDDTAAICVSRPTNPSGNVLTDEEVNRLQSLARAHGIPLIVDCAYGAPFPNILFRDATPPWGENVILTFSLSKLGLPGTRTGIVIGPPQITSAISSLNGIAGLANGSVGQALVTELIENDTLLRLSRDIIRPFYQRKAESAKSWLSEFMPNHSYRIHACEGSLFLWVRFPELPISTLELYERLKRRNVLIVPGEYFFYGSDQDWAHRNECIRMNFAMSDLVVRQGIEIIADEIRRLWG